MRLPAGDPGWMLKIRNVPESDKLASRLGSLNCIVICRAEGNALTSNKVHVVRKDMEDALILRRGDKHGVREVSARWQPFLGPGIVMIGLRRELRKQTDRFQYQTQHAFNVSADICKAG